MESEKLSQDTERKIRVAEEHDPHKSEIFTSERKTIKISEMRILILGGGGREHAIGWKLKRDFPEGVFFFSPGNGGTESIGTNVPANPENPDEVASICGELGVDLVFVGPENPLAKGVKDVLEKRGIPCFGPTSRGALIESSKAFAKRLMKRAKIPTAEFKIYTIEDFRAGLVSPDKLRVPIVIKASGLCAGKGAFVCMDRGDVENALKKIFVDREFGNEGNEIVVEEFIEGKEVSYFALCSKNDFVSIGFARDYKRLLDGDRGPNTGGMGSYTPVEYANEDLMRNVERSVVRPLMEELAREKIEYTGILYVGLILDRSGNPYVLEFNARLGDPEAQVILPVIDGNFMEAVVGAVEGRLVRLSVRGSALCVVMSAKGYPEKYERGMEIKIEGEEEGDDFVIFHAGTRREDGKLISVGGRVLGVVGLGPRKENARDAAYRKIKDIRFPNSHYRTDIG